MALSFNGANALVNIISPPVVSVPLTIACWFRPLVFQGQTVSFTSSIGATQVLLGINTSGQCITSMRDDNFQLGIATTATISATLGNWQHIACVHNSISARTAYLNGVASPVGTVVLVGTVQPLFRTAIGARRTSGLDSFANGDVAEVGVWNTVLTAEEIASLARGFKPSKICPSSLAFYTPLITKI